MYYFYSVHRVLLFERVRSGPDWSGRVVALLCTFPPPPQNPEPSQPFCLSLPLPDPSRYSSLWRMLPATRGCPTAAKRLTPITPIPRWARVTYRTAVYRNVLCTVALLIRATRSSQVCSSCCIYFGAVCIVVYLPRNGIALYDSVALLTGNSQ